MWSLSLVCHLNKVEPQGFSLTLGISNQCFRELESPISGAAGMKVAERVFGVFEGDLDLDFKMSGRSGEDVSLRNGINTPAGRAGV